MTALRLPARPTACAAALLLSLAGAVLPACGGDDGGTPEDARRDGAGDRDRAGGAATGAWEREPLPGPVGPDQPLAVAAGAGQVVVALTAEDGTFTGFVAEGDGGFGAATTSGPGVGPQFLGGVVRVEDGDGGRGGWVALASGGTAPNDQGEAAHAFEVRAVWSEDGRSWSATEATGLDGPGDVQDLAAGPDGLVGVGSLRTADDPSRGGFRPAAWWSADGASWTTATLPGGEGYASGVAVVGDDVVAVGQAGDRAAVWRSADGGASWSVDEPAGLDDAESLGELAVQGDTVLLSGQAAASGEAPHGTPLLRRSTDGGHTWSAPSAPPPPGRAEGFADPLSAGGGRFLLRRSSFVDAFAEPELCYAAIALCRNGATTALYVSEDGDAWARVDTSAIDAPGLDAVAATEDGRVVVLASAAGGVDAWSWPAGVPLPTIGEPDEPAAEVTFVPEGGEPEVGVRYAAPLYVHCGMDWLFLGETHWRRTDGGPSTETGAGGRVPEGWPIAQETLFGFATLTSADVLEYALPDGEVVATYERGTLEPPGCA